MQSGESTAKASVTATAAASENGPRSGVIGAVLYFTVKYCCYGCTVLVKTHSQPSRHQPTEPPSGWLRMAAAPPSLVDFEAKP